MKKVISYISFQRSGWIFGPQRERTVDFVLIPDAVAVVKTIFR